MFGKMSAAEVQELGEQFVGCKLFHNFSGKKVPTQWPGPLLSWIVYVKTKKVLSFLSGSTP